MGVKIPSNLKLYKNNQSIKVVKPTDDCNNVIIFDEIDIEDDFAQITFKYPIEGIRCKLDFEFKLSEWKIISTELIELRR